MPVLHRCGRSLPALTGKPGARPVRKQERCWQVSSWSAQHVSRAQDSQAATAEPGLLPALPWLADLGKFTSSLLALVSPSVSRCFTRRKTRQGP